MTISRTFTALSLTAIALCSTVSQAQAGDARNLFGKFRQIQVAVEGVQKHSQNHGPRYDYSPPSYDYPAPKCHKQICPPPPPPVCHYIYCVYYLDCHGHWNLYRRYHSRWKANSAEERLRYQGYRTYLKVKHVGGGYPGTPGGPVHDDGPGGFPAQHAFNGR